MKKLIIFMSLFGIAVNAHTSTMLDTCVRSLKERAKWFVLETKCDIKSEVHISEVVKEFAQFICVDTVGFPEKVFKFELEDSSREAEEKFKADSANEGKEQFCSRAQEYYKSKENSFKKTGGD